MKRVLLALLTSALLALAGIAHADIGADIQLQQNQIADGLKAGLLRSSEAKNLTENLNRIKFEFKRAKSHGVMNHYEIKLLNQMLTENETTLATYLQNKKK